MDVSGEISNSAMSAAVEFHVDAFVAFTSKKSSVSKHTFLYLYLASHPTFCPPLDVLPFVSIANNTKRCFS